MAYEPVAVEGLNPLREAMRAYVSGNRDHVIALVRRDQDVRELDAFGLMYLVHELHSRGTEHTESKCAALVFMAPCPHTDDMTDAWLELTEALISVAGERGAQCLVAEAPEAGREVEVLQRAGFSPLIHQDVMKIGMIPEGMDIPEVEGLRQQEDKDDAYVKLLSMRVVPKLVQKAEASIDLTRLTHRTDFGFLLMHKQEPIGHISLRQGRRAYGMQVLFRQEAEDLVEPVLKHALGTVCDRNRRPVYCMIPSYQSWLLPVLDDIGFMHVTSNAIMVKHLTARVRQPVWSIQPNTAHTNLIKSETKLQSQKSNVKPEG